MDKLPIINLILIIVLFLGLLGYQIYSDIKTDNSLNSLQNNFNSANLETDKSIKDLQNQIDVEINNLRLDTQNVRDEISDYKDLSASELDKVKSNFQKLEIKQEEELKQLSAKIIGSAGSDFSGIVTDVIKSVVGISTDKSVGSGVIVDENGYIVTNHHVVDDISRAGVRTYDGGLHGMYIVGSDSKRDIAVIKIDGTFAALKFANSDRVSIGESIIALGSPGGLDFTVTQGIVSAIRDREGFDHIQTDVSVNPGNSGGPIIDSSGRIVGITKSKLEGFEGVGFAIVSNEIDDYVNNLISADKRRRS